MKKKMILFGAGEICRRSIGYAASNHLEVQYIVDNNPAKHGSVYRGIQVFSPQKLFDESKDELEIIVTVGPRLQGEVIRQLTDMGFVHGKHFITHNDKFLGGALPRFSEPAYVVADDSYKLMKQVTDSLLLTDADGKRCFRVIGPEKAALRLVYDVIEDRADLRERIIRTTLVKNDEYLNALSDLVFEHEFLPVVTGPHEWSPLMFYDYVLFMIELLKDLDKAGLGLSDFSSYNTVFHRGTFIYFDFSGIYWDKTDSFIMNGFIESHINTLILMGKNPPKANMFLRNPTLLAKRQDIVGYLNAHELADYDALVKQVCELSSNGRNEQACESMKKYVENRRAELVDITDWKDYQKDMYDAKDDSRRWSTKQREVINLIRKIKPRTLLDLAGNMGWYGIALNRELEYAINIDIDPGCIEYAYRTITSLKLKNVYPVCMNFMKSFFPNAYGGFAGSKMPSDRFCCDMTLALAVVHHLALSQGFIFEEIAARFALFTKRHLLVEFVDRDDEYVMAYLKQHPASRTAWYTKEKFELAMKTEFTILDTVPSSVPSRMLYLCEKK